MSCGEGGCGCGEPASRGGACGLSLKGGVPAVVRLVLGGLFVFAGVMKLSDLRGAFDAVHAFHLGIGDQGTMILSRVVPFAEILAGGLLVLGLWARGAAAVVILMMLGFMAGIASVMLRGMDVKCGCFGSLKMFCGDQPMGWCHIIRNTVMAVAGVLILVLGPGAPALDNRRKAGPPKGRYPTTAA